MNCRDFDNVIHEIVSQPPRDRALPLQALEHARNCLWCAVRLEEETRLTASLQAYAKILREQSASAPVEQALLRTFREERLSAPTGARFFNWARIWRELGWGMVAAVAVAAMAGILWAPRLLRHQVATPQVAKGVSPQPSTPAQVGTRSRLAPVEAKGAYRNRGQHETAEAPAELTSEFIPLGTCDDPECMDQVMLVRVEIPSEALPMFGVLADNEYPGQTVEADVALGSDGVPFGIRFLN